MGGIDDAGVCISALGALLAWSATLKLRFRTEFNAAVRTWGFGPTWTRVVSLVLPPFELTLAAGLMAAAFNVGNRTLMCWACFLTFTAFSAGQLWVWRRRPEAACGCFGRSSRSVSTSSVLRTTSLAVAAGFTAVVS